MATASSRKQEAALYGAPVGCSKESPLVQFCQNSQFLRKLIFNLLNLNLYTGIGIIIIQLIIQIIIIVICTI